MTLGDYDYDSDDSMPEEFKNTNHLNPIIHKEDTSIAHSSQLGEIGFQSDFKESSRNRAQKANKSREKATQSYVQKKLKQIEQEEREKEKQEQRRRRNGEPEEEQNEEPAEEVAEANQAGEDKSEDGSDSEEEEDEQFSSRAARGQHRSKARRGHKQQQKADRSKSRGTSRSKSRPVSDSESIKDKLGYDIIDRSNKRASRHRRPEDEILEPVVKATASIELEDEDDGEEEEVLDEGEERIRFQRNLAFKTDDEGMAARPLTSRDFKKIFEQRLTERDEARERQKEKEKEKEQASRR